jgi:hypothetical protein
VNNLRHTLPRGRSLPGGEASNLLMVPFLTPVRRQALAAATIAVVIRSRSSSPVTYGGIV